MRAGTMYKRRKVSPKISSSSLRSGRERAMQASCYNVPLIPRIRLSAARLLHQGSAGIRDHQLRSAAETGSEEGARLSRTTQSMSGQVSGSRT